MISQANLPTMMSADVYTDLQGLQSIKQQAKGDDTDKNAALNAVAKQFESLFLDMMMKSMRDANEAFKDDSMSGSNEMAFYERMFDQQLTLSLSKTGVGLSDALVRQLQSQMGTPVAMKAPEPLSGRYLPASFVPTLPGLAEMAVTPADTVQYQVVSPDSDDMDSTPKPNTGSEGIDDDFSGDPEQFKEALWPIANRAAAEIGVDPRYLMSQAALETGWGKHMIKGPNGENSFNLFGIKASNEWDGKKAVVKTLEYRRGIPQQETATFKAYDSLEHSFQDYVDFVTKQSRYSKAVNSAANPSAYVKELQSAGYATDPKYAEKIEAIVKSHFSDRG